MESYPCYLAGTWRSTEARLTTRSPFDGRPVAEVHLASARDIADAVARAAEAFAESRRLPAHARETALAAIARGVEAERDLLARAITLEMGKTIRESRAEVDRTIQTLRVSAEEAKRLAGEWLDLAWAPGHEGKSALIRRFPRGVVAGISPFNFPLNLVAHKLGPALACGAPIVLKPSPRAPTAALLLARLVERVPLPPGMLSVVPGGAAEGEALATDPRVKVVSFTGSAEVGWALKSRVPRKQVILELGGNAAMIVEPDADLAWAAARAAAGAFALAGQSCISVQLVLVARSASADLTERLVAAARSLRSGDPLSEETDLGPLVDEAAAVRVAEWVEEARRAGARVLTGGRRDGAFYQPTVLADVPSAARIACQEVFGPVVAVAVYDDLAEAVAQVNASEFGLQAALFTRDMEKILLAHEALEVGGVVVNDIPSYRADHMPYGGQKLSGVGREGPRYAIEEMTEARTLVLSRQVR